MRTATVARGIRFITFGVLIVIVATYCNETAARIFSFSHQEQFRFVALGITWGGILGCAGVLVTIAGFLGRREEGRPRSIFRPALVLLLAFLLFFLLFFLRHEEPKPGRLRPGETVTI